MATFNRIIKFGDGSTTRDKDHPLFNYYSAIFFYFEQGTLKKELSESDNVDVILLSNGQLTATLQDGRKFLFG